MSKAQEAEWIQIDWNTIQYKVSKLQSKIYKASLSGDQSSVVKYQKILINSYNAKLLAVKRVTQDNRGKRTAGVDGKTVLSAEERIALAGNLKLDRKASPLKRVEILKSNGKTSQLGVPTMEDRAKQALAKMALEPEWEAKFEPNSYGFRPGRSSQDAIEAIELQIRRKTKYVLDADVKGCFDNINHQAILDKCNTFPVMEHQIRAWLKCGVLKGDVFHKAEKGTAQGGVISPLLANIALHGLETHISSKFPQRKTRIGMAKGKFEEICEARLIRYADDFVILHAKEETILQAKEEVENWLQELGLQPPEKIRLCHTKDQYNEEKPGFDFLGFNIRTYDVGKYKSNKKASGEPLMMLTKVRPSKDGVEDFISQVKEILERGHEQDPITMIKRLSWLIRGWANYFKSGSHSWETFSELQSTRLHIIYRNWGKKRYSKRGLGYIYSKIFHKTAKSQYTFGWKKEGKLYTVPTLYEFPYTPHIKVQGNRSPYDGDWMYWVERMSKHPETPKDIKDGIKKQKGKCYLCGVNLTIEDCIEIHHIDGNRNNNRKKNKAVVHNHCHDRHHRMTVQRENQVSDVA